jgi:tetratricopeptide (TPR) repeat protein
VRITVRLSEVATGFQLWSERYESELKDIFDVQDEIAKAIADRLRVTLAGGKDDRLVEQATANIEAYQLYLKGRALVDRRGASVPVGLDLLRKAVELDPGYSLAWAGVADALTVMAYSGAARGSDSKAQAMTAARRAIELEPASAVGHTSLASATLLFENNRTVAKQMYERALELNPGYAMGRCWYAHFYLNWACGDFEKGIAETRRALDSDPLSAYITMSSGAVCSQPACSMRRSKHAGGRVNWTPIHSCRAGRSASRSEWLDGPPRRSQRSKPPPSCRDATRWPSLVWLASSRREDSRPRRSPYIAS